MKISCTSAEVIIIEFTKDELSGCHLTYEKLRDSQAKSKAAICRIIEETQKISGESILISPETRIDILPDGEGGCIIVLNSRQEKKEFENIIDELPEALDSEESIDEKCQSAEKYMREILNRSYEKPDVTSDELSNLKMLAQGIHLNSMRVTRRSYEIPVKTGDTVTNMSVTILNGQEDKGKVQIAFDKDKQDEAFAAFGNINTEFKISGKDIKGLILCESSLRRMDLV